MVAFAFLGNTLFLTILVSMLSNTFSTIVSNATAEIQFRHAVLTLEGVKGDAIFAYQPPFNILAMFILVPLKFLVNPRWFHKIHVAAVRLLNLPLLLIIAVLERRSILPLDPVYGVTTMNNTAGDRSRQWFWEKWRITTHGDIHSVFELPPPDEIEEDIAVDDELTRHLIRRQFTRNNTVDSPNLPFSKRKEDTRKDDSRKDADGDRDGRTDSDGRQTPQPKPLKMVSRRDSIAPFPGLRQEISGILGDSEEMSDLSTRIEALEESNARIEAMLAKLVGDLDDDQSMEEESEAGKTGTLRDLDRTADEQ